MFFNKSRSKLNVFFKESRNDSIKTYVEIQYSESCQDLEFVAQDYFLYYTKVLDCLGRSDPSYATLLSIISNAFKNLLEKNYSIMKDSTYELEFMEDIQYPDWNCSAKFYDNSLPITKFDNGKEGYYASMSCIAFLQYIKNHFNEDDLPKFRDGILKIASR